MATGKPKLLKDLLSGESLAALVERAAATDVLARRVQSVLPPDVASHVTGANLHDDRLVVLVDGAAWAAHVRFEASSIRRGLRDNYELEITAVTVRVRPPEPDREHMP